MGSITRNAGLLRDTLARSTTRLERVGRTAMSEPLDPVWVYNETVKMFAISGEPTFEDVAEQTATWGRTWGVNNDVGPDAPAGRGAEHR